MTVTKIRGTLALCLAASILLTSLPAFASEFVQSIPTEDAPFRSGAVRLQAARFILELQTADRNVSWESKNAVWRLAPLKAHAVLMPRKEQQDMLIELHSTIGSQSPNWNHILPLLESASKNRVDDHELILLIEQVLLFPRGDKISEAHGQCLLKALAAAGNSGTPEGIALLLRATTLEFWEEVGPVRAAQLSRDHDMAVQILRLNAISKMAGAPMDVAGPTLESIRDEYHDQRSLVGLPQSESRFEHWATGNAERALETIAMRETPVELVSVEPSPSGPESERLHALREAGEARVDAVAEELRARVFSPDMPATIESDISREIHAVRMEPMSDADREFVHGVLEQELAKASPDWALTRDALRASLYGAASGEGYSVLLRSVLEFSREDPVSDAHAECLMAALTAAGYAGTSSSVALLEQAATRAFWEANGPTNFPAHHTSPPIVGESLFEPTVALMQHAIDSLAWAPSEFAEPALDRLYAAHEHRVGDFMWNLRAHGHDFDRTAAHDARKALRIVQLRESAATTDTPGTISNLIGE